MPRIHRIHRTIAISALLMLGVSACDSKKDDATPSETKKAEQALEKAEQKVEKAEQKVEQALDKGSEALPDDADLENRFEAIDKESKEDFVTRARGTITTLEAELAAAKVAGKPAESINDVQSNIDEANKDLGELENGTTKVIDDGKVGVTLAINAARRKLNRLNEG